MLIDRLSQRYQEYFDAEIMNRYGEELPYIIFNSLTHSINYQSVDHELLGYFYESTLLQINKVKAGNIRKKFGILEKYTTGCLRYIEEWKRIRRTKIDQNKNIIMLRVR